MGRPRFINYERGIVEKRYSLMSYDVRVPGRLAPWGKISPMEPVYMEPGEVADIALIEPEGGAQIPVILNRKPWLTPSVPVSTLASWPSYRNGYTRKNCTADSYDTALQPQSEQNFPIFVREWEGQTYIYGGDSGGDEEIFGFPWFLNDLELEERWLDFSVDAEGLLVQVSGYYDGHNGDVRFDGEAEPDFGPAPPQRLEQRDLDLNMVWRWTLPSISETYTWIGDNDPPGGGGGSGGGGF